MLVPTLTLATPLSSIQLDQLSRLARFAQTILVQLSPTISHDILTATLQTLPDLVLSHIWICLPPDYPNLNAQDIDTLLATGVDKLVLPLLNDLSMINLIKSMDILHNRIAVQVACTESYEELKQIAQLITGVVMHHSANSTYVAALRQSIPLLDPASIIINKCVSSLSHIADSCSSISVDADAIVYPNISDKLDCSSIPASSLILYTLKSDRQDGLFPTVVVDEYGTTLGLVYSSKASISESIRTSTGVYYSRSRSELWYKGLTSGATQALIRIDTDCDTDALCYTVKQAMPGFCHRPARTCFGKGALTRGIRGLAETLESRLVDAPNGSYTHKLFNDTDLLHAKILEEANELVDAQERDHVAQETADLIYFALTKATKVGVSLSEIESILDARAKFATRRPGNAKPQFAAMIANKAELSTSIQSSYMHTMTKSDSAHGKLNQTTKPVLGLKMQHLDLTNISVNEYQDIVKRPILETEKIMDVVRPIIESIRDYGDQSLLEYTSKLDHVLLNGTPVLTPPFSQYYSQESLSETVKDAIDLAMRNITSFHQAQISTNDMVVETMPGVTCSRIVRPIDRVGLYIPGGSAVLPSSTLMLGVPAKCAKCPTIVIATPPRIDGSIAPEVLYIADQVGAKQVVCAGGAQAIAAMAYGTESVLKVDKICGPGNQYVTAAKMVCATDTRAMVSIDMPAGPSEVLVIADQTSNPKFVASDLLSQAEHGPDSQVVLVAVGMTDQQVQAIEEEIELQASQLPRLEILNQCLPKSWIVRTQSLATAIIFSNTYAPEHLILNLQDSTAHSLIPKIINAGSVFIGAYSPESCGDYASGTNHTLPTYGYARMYSGVSTSTFVKYITTQHLTRNGLQHLAKSVVTLANVEGLHAHARAVTIRLEEDGA